MVGLTSHQYLTVEKAIQSAWQLRSFPCLAERSPNARDGPVLPLEEQGRVLCVPSAGTF